MYMEASCSFQSSSLVTPVMEFSLGSNLINRFSANCIAGQYLNKGEIICRPCKRGTYQSKARQTSCVDCPSGKTTLGEGSIAATDCVGECAL